MKTSGRTWDFELLLCSSDILWIHVWIQVSKTDKNHPVLFWSSPRRVLVPVCTTGVGFDLYHLRFWICTFEHLTVLKQGFHFALISSHVFFVYLAINKLCITKKPFPLISLLLVSIRCGLCYLNIALQQPCMYSYFMGTCSAKWTWTCQPYAYGWQIEEEKIEQC